MIDPKEKKKSKETDGKGGGMVFTREDFFGILRKVTKPLVKSKKKEDK